MTFGNPSFLNEYWKVQDLPDASLYYPTDYMSEKNNPLLEEEIRNIHKAVGNVANIDDYSIVLGNGASQLLSAILYETPDVFVTAPVPYFLRFPVLAQIGGNTFSHKDKFKKIITVPNNPTGDCQGYFENFHKADTNCLIFDACYNWPQYYREGEAMIQLHQDIIIFSLSKATGHAGARLGWALIKNKELAADVTRSIEMSSMGVGTLNQEIGRFVLRRERVRLERGDENCFTYGKQLLDARWKKLLSMEFLGFKILNKNGMFLYAEGDIPDHVEGITGDRFGDSIKKFRLNIGCSIFYFNRFINEYEKDDFV